MFLKIISWDIEVLPLRNQMPTPDKCPILLISCHFNFDFIVEDKKVRNIVLVLCKEDSENGKIEFSGDDGNRLIFYLKDEKEMLEKLFALMRQCDVITGYNICGFDFPYIAGSSSRMGDVPYVKGRWSVLGGKRENIGNSDKTVFCDSIISKGMRAVKVGNILGKIVFDVMYLLRREDESNIFKKEYNLKNVTLKHVSKEILGIEKLEFSPEEMISYWEGVGGVGTDGVIDKNVREKFIDYCSRDSELALLFVTKFRLLDRFIMMSRRSGKLLQAVVDSLGSGILVENLLLQAYKKEDRVMACRKKEAPEKIKLIGAFVREPKIGLDEYLVSLDYKCCIGDTLILTNKGITKIKDIENVEDTFVNSFKDGGDFDYKKITDFKNIGIDNTKKVTLEYGFELEGSVNHRILTVDNGSPKFVELKDLKIDDVVVLNKGSNIYGNDVIFNYSKHDLMDVIKEGQYGGYRNIILKDVCESLKNNIILPDKVNCDFSEFFGYMVSDGYVSSNNLGFTQKEDVVFNRFKELYDVVFKKREIKSKQGTLAGWFGLENVEIEEKNRYELKYRYKGGHEATISSVDLKRLFKYYGFSGNSYQKEVPWCILQSSKECQCAFLMTLFEGDGCANDADGSKYNRLHYLSKSKKLCSQVQNMLLNMGIMSDLEFIESKNDYRLDIRGYNVVLFYQYIGFVSDRKNLRTKDIVKNVMGIDNGNNEIDYDKISKKDKAGNQFPLELDLNEVLKSLHIKYVEIGHIGNKHSHANKKEGYVSPMDDPSFFRAIYRYINNNDNINIMMLKKYLKIVENDLQEDIDFRKLKWFTECNMVFLRVKNIEDGLENLFDISINETHNYISNGFISHNSLYPSLMIKHNICYSTVIMDDKVTDGSKILEMKDEIGNVYGKFIRKEVYTGIVPKLLMGLLSERATLKKELKKYEKGTSGYILFDSQQQAVKILLNSFYGYSGDNKAKLYNWIVATAVTTNGRIQIMRTINMIENDIGVIAFEGRKFKLLVVIADSVTGDMPVLFFEKDITGIFTANILPISELYNYYYGNNSLINFFMDKKEIYVEGKSGLILLKGVYKHKVTKKGFRISTCCGLTKVTEDHSLFRGGKEVKPSELNIDSYIDVTESLNIYSNLGENDGLLGNFKGGLKKDNSDLAWVLGLFVAEGNSNCTCGGKWGKKCIWKIDQNDIKVLEKCKDILDKYYKGKYQFGIMDVMESTGTYRLYVKKDVEKMVEEYRNMFYTDDNIDEYGYKKIPSMILNADEECIKEFINGYLLGDGYKNIEYKNTKREFTTNSLTLYKGLEFLFSRLKYRVTLEIDDRKTMKRDGKDYICKDRKVAYVGTIRDMSENYRYSKNEIRQIKEFNIVDESVYDLTTDDSTFVCGIGNILHHNTDSSYVKLLNINNELVGNKDNGELVRIEDAMYCAERVMEYVNSKLEKPMELAFESYIKRIVIVAKKHYAMLVEDSSGKRNIISKGIESVRRDYCNFATENLSDIIDFVLMENDVKVGIDKSIELIKNEAKKLKRGDVRPENLALSNKLTKPITAYDNLEAHVQVAIKQKERGFPYQEGDRVQYLIINNGKTLVSEKAEDYNYVIENRLKIDYNYYLNHQFLPSAIKILELLGINKEVLMVSLDEGQKNLKKWFF